MAHRMRFGVNGKFLQWFMGKRIRKQHRVFPQTGYYDTPSYVHDYYSINSRANIIQFVGH